MTHLNTIGEDQADIVDDLLVPGVEGHAVQAGPDGLQVHGCLHVEVVVRRLLLGDRPVKRPAVLVFDQG